jgi:hypothetical protein
MRFDIVTVELSVVSSCNTTVVFVMVMVLWR